MFQTASVPMKLDLIPTLQYMDASRDMTLRARLICEELLCNYVAHDMIVTILTTVTKLCCRSLTDIPKQVLYLYLIILIIIYHCQSYFFNLGVPHVNNKKPLCIFYA